MENITPDAILRQHGKWIKSSELVKLVCTKRDVKPRQSMNIIRESYENKSILKHIFSDRTVIYGLPEFGPPIFKMLKTKTAVGADFYNSLVTQFWKKREEVGELLKRSKIFTAWENTREFARIVSASTGNSQLAKNVDEIEEKMREIENKLCFIGNLSRKGEKAYVKNLNYQNEQKQLLNSLIPNLWEQMAAILSNA